MVVIVIIVITIIIVIIVIIVIGLLAPRGDGAARSDGPRHPQLHIIMMMMIIIIFIIITIQLLNLSSVLSLSL